MHAMTAGGGYGARHGGVRGGPLAFCLACGWRFEVDGATTGDAVDCPHCSRTFVLGRPERVRRRVLSSLANVWPVRRRRSRRLTRDEARGAISWTIGTALAVGIVWSLWAWRGDVKQFVRESLRDARNELVKPR